MAELVLARYRSLAPARVLLVLAALTAVALVLFMTVNARGGWDFVLPFRGRKLWGLALVAYAIAVSTVLFQTVTANRILTPAVMGFDSLYQLIQTSLVFAFGSAAFVAVDPQLRFALDSGLMVVLALVLFRWLFSGTTRSLHLLVLAGIVLGILFRTLAELMQRLLAPNEFTMLQDAMFASFNAIDPALLAVATIAIGLASLFIAPVVAQLDVLSLGRETAIGLGVDHRRLVTRIVAVVAVMVSVSTALVGPVLFFGLLVANLAYIVMPSYRHIHVLPAAVLLGIIGLVGGQTLLEHAFGFDTALSIAIEFIGGLVFLALLLRRGER